MSYMLDTNILSHIVREPRGAAGRRLRQVGAESVMLSIFVLAEARVWMAKGASPRLRDQFDLVIEQMPVVPFEEPGDIIYGELRAELERSGRTIGGNDLWIASHALSLGCILVTANEREFRRVPGLKVENWLA